VEIILGDFGAAQFSPIVISSVSATVISQHFGVSILSLKRSVEGRDELVDTVPTADTVFESGDVVLVMGSDQGLIKFERG
jgi:K+/H+ antiporter YhaU regulatory subunit KhtT